MQLQFAARVYLDFGASRWNSILSLPSQTFYSHQDYLYSRLAANVLQIKVTPRKILRITI